MKMLYIIVFFYFFIYKHFVVYSNVTSIYISFHYFTVAVLLYNVHSLTRFIHIFSLRKDL